MHLCCPRQLKACTPTTNKRQTAMAPTPMQWVPPPLNTQRAQAPIQWEGWSSPMVTLLHITMVVRRNLDLATQGAQAAIGQEGCNSPMGLIAMQVLLTDTLLFLFFSLAVFVCHITPLFTKGSPYTSCSCPRLVTSLLFWPRAHIVCMVCLWLMTVTTDDWFYNSSMKVTLNMCFISCF